MSETRKSAVLTAGHPAVLSRRSMLAGTAASLAFAGGALAQAAKKAAFLFPGSINDQSWNAQGYIGAERLKATGWEIAYTENVPAADMVEALRDYARREFQVVVGHTGRFLSAAQRIGEDFPKTLFVVGSGSGGSGQNVTSVDYNNTQFGYLMGVLAARMSKTGKVGSVNSLEGLPNVVAQVGGFRKGAKSVKPDIEVRVIYIKGMEDAAEAKEAALSLASGGTDFISGKLNAGQAGIIQAAKEKGIFCNGRSYGHTAIAPEAVLTNIVEKWGDMYVAAAQAGASAGGKYMLYGLDTPASTGAELSVATGKAFAPVVPAAVIAEIEDLKKKFASGELKVSVTREDARGGV
ncbi:BMP family ABC transporter substrate-binding protein [Phreatobacter aquaticus]|uniref:BMP family ABC transporter substrate-binding protein n=1 Tax=Phreatobacter aquaticus TaxID=2570229 RepID=A0A4D7QIV8_9HYPH|nr:BMP family protein [Phreatobacter aquaticus]QCK87600.1 BMP family ABC transporter substrate-binding protein [Phreatobacter aquaticus]